MNIRTHVLAASAAIGSLAAPAAAQYYPEAPSYPQQQQYPQVPQPYPGQPGYGYAQQGYGPSQGYAAQDPISQVINSLLGNRYNVSRPPGGVAVRLRCHGPGSRAIWRERLCRLRRLCGLCRRLPARRDRRSRLSGQSPHRCA